MQNKNIKIIVSILFLLIFFCGVYFFGNTEKQNTRDDEYLKESYEVDYINSLNGPEGDPLLLGSKEDLVSSSIWPNAKVHGILSYRGAVKGGYFFEGNILINILDANKNILKSSNAMAITEWMTAEPVDFEGNIDFTGLPAGAAYFEIHNDNASGLPENDKSVLIPIVIE